MHLGPSRPETVASGGRRETWGCIGPMTVRLQPELGLDAGSVQGFGRDRRSVGYGPCEMGKKVA